VLGVDAENEVSCEALALRERGALGFLGREAEGKGTESINKEDGIGGGGGAWRGGEGGIIAAND
jgi:hypothetical protein